MPAGGYLRSSPSLCKELRTTQVRIKAELLHSFYIVLRRWKDLFRLLKRDGREEDLLAASSVLSFA